MQSPSMHDTPLQNTPLQNTPLNVGILGGGIWGTALAIVLAQAGNHIVIHDANDAINHAINHAHENTPILPGIPLAKSIRAVSSLAGLAEQDCILLCVPAQILRAATTQLAPHIGSHIPLIVCCKGIEKNTQKLMSHILEETMPENRHMILSGPSFAREVAQKLPTAVTLAAADIELARNIAERLNSPYLRFYVSDDVIGVQIGGAVKNVLAIACGIIHGRALGESAKSAFIARAFHELCLLAQSMGGRAQTISGLSGIGDLVLTCFSPQSRNMSFGIALAKNENMDSLLNSDAPLVEGVHSAESVVVLADRFQLEMPICRATHAILNRTMSVDDVIKDFTHRPVMREID